MTTTSVRAVTIRFAGDSGDGMQLTGNQYATASAVAGNDLATFPDYPAEIRAPAGSLAGVSGFQLQFSSDEIFTPGDDLDVLVAMNPAALQHSHGDVRENGIIIVDKGTFSEKNISRAEFAEDPLADGTLKGKRVVAVDITQMTVDALDDTGLSPKEVRRCKNFFALGLAYWLYDRPLEPTIEWLERKFAKKPKFIDANRKALEAGFNFGLTTDLFQGQYEVPPATIEKGKYRKIDGNEAAAYGFIVGAKKAGLELFLGGYPITPASTLLQEMAKYRAYGIRTVQAEDEIAAASMAIGASFAGQIGLTLSSGPGIALKGEALGLAMILELPMVILNIQRGGPSTGLPTKTEQADLLQAMYGRNGESPLPIVAASRPSDCFDTALEAIRIAVQHMVPVFFLSDGYIASGSEPWKLPNVDDIEPFEVEFRTDPDDYLPYARDERCVREWAKPGTPGLEHRVGGLEKWDLTGHVAFDRENHQKMVELRAAKVEKIADEIPDVEPFGPDQGELLVLAWGSTFGSIRSAVMLAQSEGRQVAHAHLRHINPFPRNLGDLIAQYDTVLIPELNMGQLAMMIRARYLQDVLSLPKVEGAPFHVDEIAHAIEQHTTSPEGRA